MRTLLAIALALGLASPAMAWKGGQLPPVHITSGQTFSYNGVNPAMGAPGLVQFAMHITPIAGISEAFCSSLVVAAATTRCNGFREGPHCLSPISRLPLDLTPDVEVLTPVPPAIVPPAPVKPENG